MTTPNNQPTPPPGMEILTDYTQPLPEKAKVWVEACLKWLRSGQIGAIPIKGHLYAIPIVREEIQRHEIIAANERMLCKLTEAIANELGLDIEKINPPDILRAVMALKARAIPITPTVPLPGDTTNEKGGEGPYCVIAYRWGWLNNHHYIVRVTSDLQSALDAADAEASHRGGKYGVSVFNSDGISIHHARSSYGEEKAHFNERIEMFERVGNYVVSGLERDEPLTQEEIEARWKKEQRTAEVLNQAPVEQRQEWMPKDRLKVVSQPTDVNVWHLVTEADFLYVATVNCIVGEAFAKGLVETWNASLESRK